MAPLIIQLTIPNSLCQTRGKNPLMLEGLIQSIKEFFKYITSGKIEKDIRFAQISGPPMFGSGTPTFSSVQWTISSLFY